MTELLIAILLSKEIQYEFQHPLETAYKAMLECEHIQKINVMYQLLESGWIPEYEC